MNKQMRWFYTEYLRSSATELWQVYKTSVSSAKLKSYEAIKAEAKRLNAIEDVRILSHNSHTYTCGYIYPHPETGELVFRVETRDHTYEASDWRGVYD